MRARHVRRVIVPLVLAAAFAAPAVATADTVIVGGNVINQTWTAAGSPYIVQGDVTVPVGSTLRIRAGTVVRFADGDSQGSGHDPALIELTIHGALHVEGSAGNPVRLEGASISTRSWYGIVVTSAAELASLHDFELRHAAFGITHRGTRDTIAVARGLIEMCRIGVYVLGSLDADALEIRGGLADDGFVVNYGASASISNCVLRGLSHGVRNDGTVVIDHCTITGNDNAGVWSGASDAATTIRSSIISGQSRYGVISSSPRATSSIVHSNVWGNGTDYLNAAPGDGTIAANPLFVSTSDLRLQASSVCIDVAATGIAHDIVGTPRPLDGDGIGAVASDMGAYEYVPPGMPVPDAGVPDAAVPDAAVPDAAVPDAAVPDAAVPDAAVPDAAVPDAGTPAPDAAVPDAGTLAPDAGVSDAAAADGGGMQPPPDGGCSAGGGSAGMLVVALACLVAAGRRRVA